MLFRIKYILGSMLGIFSLVYMLFGIVGWSKGDATFQDLLTCFVLASIHVMLSGWLLVSSMRAYRSERARLDTVIRVLSERHGGRVTVADVASLAEVSEDDAREYLEQRSKRDEAVVTLGQNGRDVYYFGQQYWNN